MPHRKGVAPQRGLSNRRIIALVVVVIAVVLTLPLLWSIGGGTDSISHPSSARYTLSAGERRSTVWIEPGWHYKILSNKRCLIFTEEGPQRVYEVTANIPQCWKGAGLSGNILMGGVEDGTVVEFWRTQ